MADAPMCRLASNRQNPQTQICYFWNKIDVIQSSIRNQIFWLITFISEFKIFGITFHKEQFILLFHNNNHLQMYTILSSAFLLQSFFSPYFKIASVASGVGPYSVPTIPTPPNQKDFWIKVETNSCQPLVLEQTGQAKGSFCVGKFRYPH